MKKSTVDKFSRTLSVIGIIVALFSLWLGYINNKQNNIFQKDKFNIDNSPELIIDSVNFIDYSKNAGAPTDSSLIKFFVYYTNNSNQTLKIIASHVITSDDNDYILRKLLLRQINNLKPINSFSYKNIFYNIVQPKESKKQVFYLYNENIKEGRNNIHFHLVYESEKYGYYDRYVIINYEKKYIEIARLIDLIKGDTTEIPNYIFSGMLEDINKNEIDYERYLVDYQNILLFNILNFKYDSHIYISDEIEQLKESIIHK